MEVQTHNLTPSEIQKAFPSDISYDEYYQIVNRKLPKITLIACPEKQTVVEEGPPSPPPSAVSLSHESSASPLKISEDEWVTVKNRSKKKGPETDPKVETLAEVQMNNKKSKKKSIKKKLKDIQDLLKKQASGEKLDQNQLSKIQSKKTLEKELASLV